MFRKHHKKHTLFKDDEKSWYEDEDNDNEWSVQRGFTNLSDSGEEDSKQGSFSGKESFRPALENVDTNIQ
ncbi:Hypothetical predicted protein, partial [Pelobates cultripes]